MASKDEQNWGMWLHLSVLAGYLLPLAGLVAPVAIWMMKKEGSPFLDEHGKEVVNMLITVIIAAIPVTLLCFVLVGIPLAIMLGLYVVVTSIVGAMKAANGEAFHYPLAYRFIK